MWRTADSLRPNTVNLALACIEGDEESAAIVEAWRFQTNRATRLVVLAPDDPAFSRVTTFEGSGGGGGRTPVKQPSQRVTFTKVEIEAHLESSYQKYQANPGEDGTAQLWAALHLYARFMSQGSKQQSLRAIDRDEDLVTDLTLHAVQKIQNGKYAGPEPFSHWLTVVYWNFTKTRLTSLTKEKVTFVGFREGELPKGPESGEVDLGCIFENQLPFASDEDSRRYLPAHFLDSVKDPTDRAYAALLAFGLTQKEAAGATGESTVTARKREVRIRTALQGAGLSARTTQEVSA